MKNSIRKRFTAAFVCSMTVALLAVGILSAVFMDDFYAFQRRNAMEELYNMVNADDYIKEDVDRYCRDNNLYCMVTDADFNILYSNDSNVDKQVSRLFGAMFFAEDENTKVIKETDRFAVYKHYDTKDSRASLQLVGGLDKERFVIIQCSLQSIAIASEISTLFFITAFVFAGIIIAALITVITKHMTGRIEELSDISKRMAELDFSVKYNVRGEDEIDALGSNVNRMSENLEQSMAKLKTANAMLERDVAIKTQIDERRREFLSDVSHELKTPIALVQSYAEGVKEMELDKENRDAYLDVIIDEAGKMNRLVMQLMNLEQLENGSDSIDMEEFCLTDVIAGVIETQKINLENAGAKVIFDKDKRFNVYADEFKTEQIITNYLTNAIHYLEGERIIKITCTKENGTVATTVFNTGKPIPDESLDKLWNKFYKVDKARTRAYSGSGIGLSIVKAITDAHGQKCSVKNYENGVAFSFTLEAR